MSISVEEIQDWEAELSMSPLKVTEGLHVPEESWRRAIYYDGSNMGEFLWNGPSYYHDRLHGFLVAYGFEFYVDENKKLKATGSLYQATEGARGDLYTLTDEVLMEVEIGIQFKSEETQIAVVRFVKNHGDEECEDDGDCEDDD